MTFVLFQKRKCGIKNDVDFELTKINKDKGRTKIWSNMKCIRKGTCKIHKLEKRGRERKERKRGK